MPQQTIIMDKTAEASGIRVAAVGAGVIADEHEVQGLLTPVEGRMAQVTARYPGPVRSLRVSIGDTVKAGQMLASIESNLSLTTYNITSPISGTVMARNAAVGLTASEGTPLFEVVDLSSLWVDLHIFGADAGHIGAGAPVTVTRLSDGVSVETVLDRVLPGTATASQSTIARATLPNTDGLWRPGSAVKARITVDRQPADLVVPVTALQTAEDESGESSDVVYVQQGDISHAPGEAGQARRAEGGSARWLEGRRARGRTTELPCQSGHRKIVRRRRRLRPPPCLNTLLYFRSGIVG